MKLEKPNIKTLEFQRVNNIRKLSKSFIKLFISKLRASDLIDIYVESSKEYKVAKIIERTKNGLWVMLDGFGTTPDESNVIILTSQLLTY